MTSFGLETYGDSFADVYDQWYSTVTDAEATAEFVKRRAEPGPVLEAGIGTGRLAEPLLAQGLQVTGVDTSQAMLGSCTSEALPVRADMAELPFKEGKVFGAALCAFNTLFNLTDPASQQRFFDQVSARLAPQAPLIIEAMTGLGLANGPASSVGVSQLELDRLVLSATVVDADRQTIKGQHVDITEGGIRLRPWLLRWTTPEQMDVMATAAGLILHERYASWTQDSFTAESEQHVSVYLPRQD